VPYTGVICVLMLVGVTAVAGAKELSREQYVARVEPICKTTVQQTGPIMKAAKRNLQKNKVKIAGALYLEAATIIRASGDKVDPIPKPREDAAKLTEWLKRLREEDELLERTGHELMKEHRAKAQGYLVRFIHAGNRANNVVFGFGFNYCLFDVSRSI
jgi:hypothetical protein